MKKLLLLLTAMALFDCSSTTAQETTATLHPNLNNFYQGFADYENDIDCRKKAVSPATFKASLASIYSRVILSDNGAIKNGTAVSLDYEKDVKVAASYQQKMTNALYYKFGFNTGLKGMYQPIYQNKQFKNDFTVNVGLTVIGKYARRFFDNEDCEKLKTKRRQHATYLLNKYNHLLNESSKLATIKTEIDRLDKLLSLPASSANLNTLLYADDTITWKKNKKSYDSLVALSKEITALGKITNFGMYAEDRMSEFEINNPSILTGYKIHWVDIDVAVPFKGYFLYKAAIQDSLQYNLMGALQIGVTDNWVRYAKRSAFYFYWGGRALFDRGVLALGKSDTISRTYNDKSTRFQDVTSSGWYTDLAVGIAPNANFLYLIGKDKIFGVEGGASFKHYFYNKFSTATNNLWDIRLGLVANLKGEKELSKGTLGLYAQLENYNGSMGPAKDNLTIGIRVGIPVNRVLTTKE